MAFDPTSNPKVKLLCSFGGRILPRPSDNALRYVGGQTRIIAVRKGMPYPEFMAKMAEALRGPIVVVKYQLPGEDLDALVSVSCPEDLDNMMEEYDKLAAATPDGSAKLRAFLFSPAELAAEAVAAAQFDVSDDMGLRYMEAVNGGGGEAVIDMRRKDSFTSAASSNQNSEGTAGDGGGFGEGMSSPPISSFDLPVDVSNLGNGVSVATGIPAGNVLGQGLGIPAQNSNMVQQEEQMPQGVPLGQPYTEPHRVQYVVPQQFGLTGHRTVNFVPLAPHHFVPGAPVSAAYPVAASQVDGSNSVPEKVETNLPKLYGENTLQRPSDQSSKTFQQPLSQLPPLPPSLVQPHNVESYGQNQIPVGSQQPPALKLDDCLMCQKALPHAHSDTCVQDHSVDSPVSFSEAKPILYSLQSDDALKQHISHLAAQKLSENVAVQNFEKMFPAGQLGSSIQPQIPSHEYLGFRPGNQYHPGTIGIPDAFSSNGLLIGNHMQHYVKDTYELHLHPQQQQQLQTQTLQQPQYLVKKDNVATLGDMSIPSQPQQRWQTMNPSQFLIQQNVHNALGDPNIEQGLNFQDTNPLSQYCGPEMPYDYAQPIDRRLEMLHLSQHKQFDDRKSMAEHVVAATGYNAQPYLDQNPVLDNDSMNCRVTPDGRYIRPVEQIPFNQMPTMAGYDGPLPSNFGMGVSHTIPCEQYYGTTANSYCLGSECRDTSTIPLPDWKDDGSRLRSQEIPGHFKAHPYPFSTRPTEQLENFDELMPSESLLSYQEPLKVPVGSKLPPPPPNIIGRDSAESCPPNQFGRGNGSNIVALLEEGNLHHPLNSDSSLGTVHPAKESEEENIKQQLQAVAEDVAASVLEPNAAFPAGDFVEDQRPEFSNEQVVDNNNSGGFGGVELFNSKQQDRLDFGLHLDDLGHLQIIKNNDLEELSELGSGTFGTVYHGKWRGTDVAIKRINNRCFAGKQSEQERMRTDFWNEARKLADLHHPNVVAFYGVVVDGPSGSVATVTEYMVNGSLRQAWQKNDKVFDQRKRLLIAMDVAFGMEYLHAKKIIHFDLKSDNLLVNLRDPQRPICKVGDLGLSKVKCKTLISGGMRGTLPWMAPELLYGNDSLVSEKVDVYSFGVVMWELLTGEEPYGDLHYGAIIGGIVSNSLRPSVPDSCDPEWRALMEQCWSAEPAERPTFTEIANRLRNIAAALPHKGQIQGQK